MRAFKRSKNRGFTLVELMIVVAIIGVLAALAIYGVNKYLASSKTSEAKNNVGAITRAAVAAFERETYNNQLLPDGSVSATAMHALCLSASAAVPAAAPLGKKYQPSTAVNTDFNSGDQLTGWTCLGFSLTQPIYYSYNYQQGVTDANDGADATGFSATAAGDLDGNGTNSYFGRGAVNRNGQIVLSTQVAILNEYE